MLFAPAAPKRGQLAALRAALTAIMAVIVAAALAGCGDDFSACSFEQASDGSTLRVCRDEDGDVLSSSEVAGCVVDKAVQLSDGTVELLCSNGSKVSVEPGQDGLPGNSGQGCEVLQKTSITCELVCSHTSVELACGTGGGAVTPYQLCSFVAPPALNDASAYLAVADAYADGSSAGLQGCQALKLSTPVTTTGPSVVFYHGACTATVAVLGAVSGAVSWDVGHTTFQGSATGPTYADFGSAGCAVAFGGGSAQVAILPYGGSWPSGASQ